MTHLKDGQDQVSGDRDTAAPGTRRPKGLARWYWGTAGLLIVAALGVSTLAGRQVDGAAPVDEEVAEDRDPGEDSGGWADAVMREAEQAAMKVMDEIDPDLDAAFAPVYAGIPRYMDFHYSLKGEWLELSASVLGQMENQLEEHLFTGLEDRIADISQGLQTDFDRLWLASVEASLAESLAARGPFVELARQSVRDAQERVGTTAAVFGSLGVGASALAVVPHVVATKLGQKIAGKVAVRTGARWATVASGAGSGALLCSWAGPAAAACAVAGIVVTWVGVDYAMIKLDEHVSRDDFEQELHALVDEQKAAIRNALQDILTKRMYGAQTARKDVVMKISLAELPVHNRRMACQAVEEILPPYFGMVDDLRDRSPARLEALRAQLAPYTDDRLLAPWVARVQEDIASAGAPVAITGGMTIKVQVPPEIQNGRPMRADLRVGHLVGQLAWIDPDSHGNFVFFMTADDEVLPVASRQKFSLELMQGGGVFGRDRLYNGEANFWLHNVLPDLPGLSAVSKVHVGTSAESVSSAVPRVTVEIPVTGASIERAEAPEFCTI